MASKKILAVVAVVIVFVVILAVIAISQPKAAEAITQQDRLDAIPSSAVKQTPAGDIYKPVMHSPLWGQPVPMPGLVNTAGAEDSSFVTANGTWFFFFFTPDVSVPAPEQLLDGVTGIWWCHMTPDGWSSPEKIVLSDDVSMDGAHFVLGNTMWFASVRQGNYGEIDYYTAEYRDGKWTDVKNAGTQINVDYDIGEMHLTADGNTMYFHSGTWLETESMDIWTTERTSTGWSNPVRVPGINSDRDEGYPFVSSDGSQLLFTSMTSTMGYTGPAIFRSVLQANGTWSAPEEILSNFAGEPTMDDDGNLYFVHHYFDSDRKMIEADIYMCPWLGA